MEVKTPDEHPCSLNVPNDLSFMPLIRDFVGDMATLVGFAHGDRERIELAVEEATTNVIQHAFGPGETASFDITCVRTPVGLEVRIHDMGLPFDPARVPTFEPGSDLESPAERGLGWLLMRSLMDEYHFCNLGRDGKEIRMIKYLDAPTAAPPQSEVAVGEPVADGAHDDSRQPQDVEYEVRRLRPEEAIEVARCVYDSYGYSYAGEQAYQPERIAALNESGDLISAVAVTADGEVIGHSALVMHDELPPEVAMAATKRSARGLGIATKLCAFLIDQLRLTGSGVLQARQVTVHPYTQRFCSKLGFLDCGFLLAHSPKSQSWRGMDTVAQRNSDIVGVLILEPREPVTLFPPQRHAQIIERLLEQVHVPATLVHEPQSSGSEVGAGDRHGQSVVHVAVSPTRSLAEIHIAHYGTDVVEALRRELYWLRREDVRVVELYVDLSIPVAAQLAPTLEDLGFMFTGVMPKTDGHHAMIMQFLNGVQVDYDELHVISDMACELLAHIRANDPFAV